MQSERAAGNSALDDAPLEGILPEADNVTDTTRTTVTRLASAGTAKPVSDLVRDFIIAKIGSDKRQDEGTSDRRSSHKSSKHKKKKKKKHKSDGKRKHSKHHKSSEEEHSKVPAKHSRSFEISTTPVVDISGSNANSSSPLVLGINSIAIKNDLLAVVDKHAVSPVENCDFHSVISVGKTSSLEEVAQETVVQLNVKSDSARGYTPELNKSSTYRTVGSKDNVKEQQSASHSTGKSVEKINHCNNDSGSSKKCEIGEMEVQKVELSCQRHSNTDKNKYGRSEKSENASNRDVSEHILIDVTYSKSGSKSHKDCSFGTSKTRIDDAELHGKRQKTHSRNGDKTDSLEKNRENRDVDEEYAHKDKVFQVHFMRNKQRETSTENSCRMTGSLQSHLENENPESSKSKTEVYLLKTEHEKLSDSMKSLDKVGDTDLQDNHKRNAYLSIAEDSFEKSLLLNSDCKTSSDHKKSEVECLKDCLSETDEVGENRPVDITHNVEKDTLPMSEIGQMKAKDEYASKLGFRTELKPEGDCLMEAADELDARNLEVIKDNADLVFKEPVIESDANSNRSKDIADTSSLERKFEDCHYEDTQVKVNQKAVCITVNQTESAGKIDKEDVKSDLSDASHLQFAENAGSSHGMYEQHELDLDNFSLTDQTVNKLVQSCAGTSQNTHSVIEYEANGDLHTVQNQADLPKLKDAGQEKTNNHDDSLELSDLINIQREEPALINDDRLHETEISKVQETVSTIMCETKLAVKKDGSATVDENLNNPEYRGNEDISRKPGSECRQSHLGTDEKEEISVKNLLRDNNSSGLEDLNTKHCHRKSKKRSGSRGKKAKHKRHKRSCSKDMDCQKKHSPADVVSLEDQEKEKSEVPLYHKSTDENSDHLKKDDSKKTENLEETQESHEKSESHSKVATSENINSNKDHHMSGHRKRKKHSDSKDHDHKTKKKSRKHSTSDKKFEDVKSQRKRSQKETDTEGNVASLQSVRHHSHHACNESNISSSKYEDTTKHQRKNYRASSGSKKKSEQDDKSSSSRCKDSSKSSVKERGVRHHRHHHYSLSSDDTDVSNSPPKNKVRLDAKNSKDSFIIQVSDDDPDVLSEEMIEKLHNRLTASIKKSRARCIEKEMSLRCENQSVILVATDSDETSEDVTVISASNREQEQQSNQSSALTSLNFGNLDIPDIPMPPSPLCPAECKSIEKSAADEPASVTTSLKPSKPVALGKKAGLKLGLKISESSVALISLGGKGDLPETAKKMSTSLPESTVKNISTITEQPSCVTVGYNDEISHAEKDEKVCDDVTRRNVVLNTGDERVSSEISVSKHETFADQGNVCDESVTRNKENWSSKRTENEKAAVVQCSPLLHASSVKLTSQKVTADRIVARDTSSKNYRHRTSVSPDLRSRRSRSHSQRSDSHRSKCNRSRSRTRKSSVSKSRRSRSRTDRAGSRGSRSRLRSRSGSRRSNSQRKESRRSRSQTRRSGQSRCRIKKSDCRRSRSKRSRSRSGGTARKSRSHRSRSRSRSRSRRPRSKRSRSRTRRSKSFESRSRTSGSRRSKTRRSRSRTRRSVSRQLRTKQSRSRSRSHKSNSRESRSSSDSRRRSSPASSRLNIDKQKLREIAMKNLYCNLQSGITPVEHKPADAVAVKPVGKSVEELTEFCKKIAEQESKGGAGTLANVLSTQKQPAEEDDDSNSVFTSTGLKTTSASSIVMNIRNAKQLPVMTSQEKAAKAAALRTKFPVSSGTDHRCKESEWVPVTKVEEKVYAAPPSDPNDVASLVDERQAASRKLKVNPRDKEALETVFKVQQQIKQWSEAEGLQPGQFTGTTGVQTLTPQELGSEDPRFQAWVKKDTFVKAAPVTGGIGKLLMEKMGWKAGCGLGKHNEGITAPIPVEIKTDRKGLTSSGEHFANVSGSATQDLSGKHPVSALNELCSKRRWLQPQFILLDDAVLSPSKLYRFKVVVNNVEYQPAIGCTIKKTAKMQAAQLCLQELGIISKT